MIEFALKLLRSPAGMPIVLNLVATLFLISGTLGVLFSILTLLSGGIGALDGTSIAGPHAWFIIALASVMNAAAGYFILVEVAWSRHFLVATQLGLFILAGLLAPDSFIFSARELFFDALWFGAIIWLFYGTRSATHYYATLRGALNQREYRRDSAF
jgi:hypothetical protein